MLSGSGSPRWLPLLVALTMLPAIVFSPASSRPSGAAVGAPARFIGAVLAADESPTISWGRDGGISVPLPGGRDLWIFADGPRYQYSSQQQRWKLNGFIYGSSAGEQRYTSGHLLSGPLQEVVLGHALTAKNTATQLIPSPNLYLPDGSRRPCNRTYGGASTAAVRWATGAALMPDQTNVLIPFLDVCVTSAYSYVVEGWGFTEYNWKTNRLSVSPIDVFPAAKSGAAISEAQYFRSPVVVGKNVTFFSSTCCSPGSVFTTTIAANTAALRSQASYVSVPVAGLPATFWLSVVAPSTFSPHYLMYWMNGVKGEYRVYSALQPTGPWNQQASGTLPRCASNPYSCRNSIYMHPELSRASQLVVSYYFPGYGPGNATKHPYPHLPLGHVVWATIPV